MLTGLRRAACTLRRDPRPVLAALLVLAQGVAAVGGPVVVRNGEHLRPCGCKVRGPNALCCCAARTCCDVPSEPEPPHCAKCRAKEEAKHAAIQWLNIMQARQCQGESPIGLMADIPAIPPLVPPASFFLAIPTASLRLTNQFATSLLSIPPDPPPRRG
ncbi:MAG TPA: hypothetical protein VLM40_19230 [Gemmata sp.]|nr:hypothetical protein [Gemmata sp.]